jgi:hypothetical protein
MRIVDVDVELPFQPQDETGSFETVIVSSIGE